MQEKKSKATPSRARNLSLTSIIALTSFIPVIIIFIALFAGLWIDSRIGRRGPATICMLVLSAPISIFVMVRIALWLVHYVRPQVRTKETVLPEHTEEE